jgi:hypothetical protein
VLVLYRVAGGLREPDAHLTVCQPAIGCGVSLCNGNNNGRSYSVE